MGIQLNFVILQDSEQPVLVVDPVELEGIELATEASKDCQLVLFVMMLHPIFNCQPLNSARLNAFLLWRTK